MKIAIIGHGTVGKAIAQAYCSLNKVFVIDKHYSGLVKSDGTFLELNEEIENCDIGFVCLPYEDSSDGEILLSAIARLNRCCRFVVLKSTVDFEFLRTLEDSKVLLMPEFLTEKNSLEDYKRQTQFIVSNSTPEFEDCFRKLHYWNVLEFTSVNRAQAALIKLFRNAFLASKVALFNQFYEIVCASIGGPTEASNLVWQQIQQAICLDPRIGKSHSNVPGPDGKLGFGGTCFPKDLKLLLDLGKIEGADTSMLKSVEVFNNNIRELD
jgi:UDP-glucose 6-dehydrogenase